MGSLVLPLSAVFCLVAHSVSGSPIMGLEQSPLEEDMPFFDDVFTEQDGIDFNTLLQSMKDEFLKTLNLSDIPLQDTAKVDPPEYMLELYNKFATDRTSMPSANIIRSFQNEGRLAYVCSYEALAFLYFKKKSVNVHVGMMRERMDSQKCMAQASVSAVLLVQNSKNAIKCPLRKKHKMPIILASEQFLDSVLIWTPRIKKAHKC